MRNARHLSAGFRMSYLQALCTPVRCSLAVSNVSNTLDNREGDMGRQSTQMGLAAGSFVTTFPTIPQAQLALLESLLDSASSANGVAASRGSGSQGMLDFTVAMHALFAAIRSGHSVTVVADAAPPTRENDCSSQEVADQLSVSRPYVVKLARSGELPHYMVGNRHRFLKSDVDAYEARSISRRREHPAALAPVDGYTDDDFRIHDLD